MRHASETVIALAILVSRATALPAGEAGTSHWPRFRGPGARGLAEGGATPAIADGTLFFRTRSRLVAVGARPVSK